jgi:hypothetical protein
MRALWYFSIGVFCAVAASGQAIVEHSVATAGASAAAGGLKDTGKSIGGVFRGLSETMDKAGSAKKSGNTTRSSQSKQSVKPVPASPPIDPSQVTEGLDRAELIQRFGEPVLRFSERRNSQLVERFWYNTTTPDQVEIRLIGDKVASVRPPANTKQ